MNDELYEKNEDVMKHSLILCTDNIGKNTGNSDPVTFSPSSGNVVPTFQLILIQGLVPLKLLISSP